MAVSATHKKHKRKASIPAPSKGHVPRMAQSVGPSILQTDGSMEDLPTAAKTTNVSVTKGTSNKGSSYPNYFFTPKENVFEAKRGSRYDKGKQPKAFHLTQPDTSLAKFVFLTKESKKPERGSQSMVNSPEGTTNPAAFQSIMTSA